MIRKPHFLPAAFFLWVLLTTVIFITNCGGGGGSSSPPPVVLNPTPTITSFTPATTLAGSAGTNVSIQGTGFLASSTVTWNNAAKPAVFVSSAELRISVAATELASAGNVAVGVSNPPPGGGTVTGNFPVGPPLAPVITSLSPASTVPGSGAFTLTVNGSNFVSASAIQVNGNSRPTNYVDNTRLTAAVAGTDVTAGGTLNVSVLTPAPGGGTSTAATFKVEYPVPVVSTISPATVVVGGPAFNLTVLGSNFHSGALVRFNNISRVTTFVSSTELRAEILAADINTTKTAQVTVENPAPSAGISAQQPFIVGNPVPVIATISPNPSIAATDPLTIDIDGTGFVPSSKVEFEGKDVGTAYVSSTRIRATLRGTDTPRTGLFGLRVINPEPGGGTSGSVTLTATASGPGVDATIVAIRPDGTRADYCCEAFAMSDDARFVAFPYAQHTLRDTCESAEGACTPKSTIFSTTQDGVAYLHFSSKGRYLLWKELWGSGFSHSVRSRLQDTCQTAPVGCTVSESRPDVYVDGTMANGGNHAMSGNGRYVAFGEFRIELRDTCISAPPGCVPATVPVANPGYVLALSRSARYLVYLQIVYGNETTIYHYLHDTCIGAPSGCSPASAVVAITTGNYALDFHSASVSDDGRYVAFVSKGPTLVPNDMNAVTDAFVYDTCRSGPAGCTPSMERVSISTASGEANGATISVSMSDDGRFVVFDSEASNLAPNDTNGTLDTFLRDRCTSVPGCTPSTTRLSLSAEGVQTGSRYGSKVTPDGKFILLSGTLAGTSSNTLVRIKNPKLP